MEVRETTLGSFGDRENQVENNSNPTLTPDLKGEGQSDPTPTDLHNEDVSLNPTAEDTTKVVPNEAAPVVEEENTTSFAINFDNEPAQADANKPAETTQNQPQISWQDAIKNVDPKEVAKALGLSDFALELNDHLSKGGQAIDYLQAKSVDYNKIPALDLVKDDLRKQFPNVSNDDLNLYIQKKYHQSELSDDEDKVVGTMEMEAYANQIRQREIAKQQSFKIPETPVANNQKEWEAQQQQAAIKAQQEFEATSRFYAEHEATKSLIENKRVVFDLGEGNKPYNVKLDKPEMLMQLFTDNTIWNRVLSNEKGEPDVAHMQRVGLVAANKNIFKDIFNAGKAAGLRSIVDENQNARRPDGAPVVAMQNQGVVYKGLTTMGAHNNR